MICGLYSSEDGKGHKRSTTQPLRSSGAKSAGQSAVSPLKSSKISSSTLPNHHTNASGKRTSRHSLTSTTAATASSKRWVMFWPVSFWSYGLYEVLCLGSNDIPSKQKVWMCNRIFY